MQGHTPYASICSMVLAYLLTFTPKMAQFCRSILQHHGAYGYLHLLEELSDKSHTFPDCIPRKKRGFPSGFPEKSRAHLSCHPGIQMKCSGHRCHPILGWLVGGFKHGIYFPYPISAPWCCNIYLQNWAIFGVNVSKAYG